MTLPGQPQVQPDQVVKMEVAELSAAGLMAIPSMEQLSEEIQQGVLQILQNVTARFNELRDRVDKNRARVKEDIAELVVMRDELFKRENRFEIHIEAEEAKFETWNKKADEQRELLRQQEENMAKRKAEFFALEERLKQKEKALLQREKELENRNEEWLKLDAALKAREVEVEKKSQIVEDISHNLRKARNELDEKKAALAKANDGKLREAEKNLQDALMKVDQKDEMINDLKEKLSESEVMMNFKLVEIDSINSELGEYKERAEALEAELEAERERSKNMKKVDSGCDWTPLGEYVEKVMKENANVTDRTQTNQLHKLVTAANLLNKGQQLYVKVNATETFTAFAGLFEGDISAIKSIAQGCSEDKVEALIELIQNFFHTMLPLRASSRQQSTSRYAGSMTSSMMME